MNKTKDLTDQRFGMLTVLKRAEGTTPKHYALWLCRCDCGKEKILSTRALKRTRSCGCMRGRVIGKLDRSVFNIFQDTPYPPNQRCNRWNGDTWECEACTELFCATRGTCSFFREREAGAC